MFARRWRGCSLILGESLGTRIARITQKLLLVGIVNWNVRQYRHIIRSRHAARGVVVESPQPIINMGCYHIN
jgi:hypothetical protein